MRPRHVFQLLGVGCLFAVVAGVSATLLVARHLGGANPHNAALTHAITVGDVNMAKTALAQGADPDHGILMAPLHFAAVRGRPEIELLLLQHGAHINARSGLIGSSALQGAVIRGQFESVRLLVDHGADVNQRNYFLHTALYFAARARSATDKTKILSYLQQHGAHS